MKRNYKYLWSLTPGLVVIAGNLMGGWWAVSNLVFSLGFLALFEWFFPEDKDNTAEATSSIPDRILVLHVFLQIAALTSLFYAVSNETIKGWQYFLACVSTGVHTGSGSIVVAHEMIHRPKKKWQQLGKFLLFSAGNIYFYVEHLRVHHRHVGTEMDPATARLNESLYSFYLRTTIGQVTGAWKMESDRLKKEGGSPFQVNNYLIASGLLLFVLFILLWFLAGPLAVFAFVIQALVANFLLEYTNYIEHYGLTRKENERITEIHSWQSDKVISRFFLIDLSRHSDHHYYASKPYHTLDSWEKSPVLPGGYASGIYLALIPPLWFYLLNKRIREFYQQS